MFMPQCEPVARKLTRRSGGSQFGMHESPPLHRSICDCGRVRRLEPDDVLIHQATEPSFVGVVLSGVLRLQKLHEDGTYRVLRFLFPGALFGNPCRGSRRTGVEAATAAHVACVDHRTFMALMEADRALERTFFAAALDELDAAYELSSLLGNQRRDARVAAYLHCLIARGIGEITPSGRRAVELPVPRRDVAAYLAIAGETLCRSLHALERAGAIRLIEANRIEVVDEGRLCRIAGDPQPARPKYGTGARSKYQADDGGQCTAEGSPPSRFTEAKKLPTQQTNG
ncbi:nitrogen fixation regulation protein FixK [Roseomonas sp. TAS13]|uniref:Crp/Fnr family transcriptional regulator n=1 Tax=Roseomonas TaxID=125216 RepID=UPI000962E3A0|nr:MULTISPECIES: Crp/Fnr family transcriptional regulator [Roseomonas]MCG7353067.1 Crp/Fnr family transcriptional regulator [Roseomonas mucosa]MCG7358317.1 Crp/Fnr family transcriptional regulator [Roseomonas mucosa]GAV33354.1 nitrogen fixation regulation protein FixK [Roseomonas sp. TAS13]